MTSQAWLQVFLAVSFNGGPPSLHLSCFLLFVVSLALDSLLHKSPHHHLTSHLALAFTRQASIDWLQRINICPCCLPAQGVVLQVPVSYKTPDISVVHLLPVVNGLCDVWSLNSGLPLVCNTPSGVQVIR